MWQWWSPETTPTDPATITTLWTAANTSTMVCVCGKCRQMGQVVEQVCCRRRGCCITDLEAFETIALDISVLSVAILNRCEITADDPEYTPSRYHNAVCKQFIVWQNGYLGPRNRHPIPAWVVWAIRDRFPELSGTYLGFREY